MRRTPLLMTLAVGFLVAGALALAQEATKEPPPPAVRGSLPPNFKRLDLTEVQKEKIQTIRGTYRARISQMEKQLHELRDKEREEIDDVLTDAQKAKLREIMTERAPKESKKPAPKESPEKPEKEKKPETPTAEKKP